MSAIPKQSLLFNTTEHNKGRAFNKQDGTGYQARIMIQTLKSSGVNFSIKEFKTIDAIRSFIAENYTQHKRLFDIAMNNELSQMKAIVYSLNLEVAEEMRTHLVDAAQYNVIDHVYSHVKLPKSAHKNLKAFIQLHNGKPMPNQRKLEMHNDGNVYYNTMAKDDVHSMQLLANVTNEQLIIATEDMALKYKIKYKVEMSKMQNPSTGYEILVDNLKIIGLELVPMSEQDYKFIEEAQ